MYAIIEVGGKQHRVSAGDVVKVERLNGKTGSNVEWSPLLVVDGGNVVTAAKAASMKVKAKILGEGKHRKVLVFHKKRRKQYKKLYGHRQMYTQVEILDIAKS
ncbi:MAG: 50S ribosomal protein L21 [Acidobacteriota bacterium]|jgi:large subunit ribosomal protein L21